MSSSHDRRDRKTYAGSKLLKLDCETYPQMKISQKPAALRVLASMVLLVVLVASCDLTETEPAPTPVAITSTPTEAARAETAAEPSASAPASPTDAAPTGTPQPTQPLESNELEETLQQIEQQVVEIRGLQLLSEIPKEVIDRQELVSRVDDLVAEDYSPEEARVDSLTYWLLGLIPDRELDLYQLQIDLLGEQIAGYYDPETDELVVVTQTGELEVADKVTMAHEIVHGLQDQHFNLVALDDSAQNVDQSAAISALVEGDASFTMGEYVFAYLDPMELAELFGQSQQEFPVLDSAPRYIQEGLLFPYQDGQTFIQALESAGGDERVNAAFENPPLSTEQILHPEKYLGENPDQPATVDLPDISGDLGDGWEQINSNVLGEWDINIMLDENGASNSEQAAAGWGGSRFAVYEQGDDSAVAVLRTTWDTPDDRAEFEGALQEMLADLEPAGDLVTDGQRFMTVTSNDQGVTFISGTDSESVTATVTALQS